MNLNIFFEKYNSKKIIISGLLFILLINMVVFPLIPKLFSTENYVTWKILDLQFGFNKFQVIEILQNLHAEGRDIYFYSTLFVDTPYAIVYGFIYSVFFYSLLKKLNKINIFGYIFFIPFLISIFDVFENLFTLFFIKQFPDIATNLILAASIVNQLKWSFALLTFFIFLILIISVVLKKNLKK